MTQESITFGEWLALQTERHDRVGLLARNMRTEKRMRPEKNSLIAWRDWLETNLDSRIGRDLRRALAEYLGVYE